MVRCFLCLSCDPEHFQSIHVSGKGNADGNINILLNYLLETKNNKNEDMLKDITAMLEESRKPARMKQNDNPPKISSCDKCKERAKGLAELHQELEKTQMKIVQELKSFRRKILQNFTPDTGGEELCKILESKKIVAEHLELGGSGADKNRGQRKLLEIVANFQKAVYEKGTVSVDVPCVILDKFAFSRYSISNWSWSNELNNRTIKNESEVDDDDRFSDHCDYDVNPMDAESIVSTNPNLSSTTKIPKVKLKSTSEVDTEWKPDGESDLEDDEPRNKRSRRTTSRVANCSISKTKQGIQKEFVQLAKKSKCAQSRNSNKESSKINKEKERERSKNSKKYLSRLHACELCSYSTRKPFNYEQHLNNHETKLRSSTDQTAQFTCDQCSKSFFSKQLHTFHMEGHQGRLCITCDSCNVRIRYPEIEDHLRTHTDKIYTCINCSFRCTTRDRYLLHLRMHGRGRLECDLCSKAYSNRVKLQEHLFEEHKVGDKHVCNVENCNKEFYNGEHLRIHMKIHTNPLGCSQCGKVYGDKTKLKVHQRSHTDEKAFRCSECNESFRLQTALQSHKILVHGAEKFTCEYCGKEYINRNSLLGHLTIHETTSGIPCGICDKVLESKALWKEHKKRHTIKNIHICEECGKVFTTRQGLKRHSEAHGGKKYKCQFCGREFLAEYLKIHERTHTGERPFTCEICGKSFIQSGSLTLHRRKIHPDHQRD